MKRGFTLIELLAVIVILAIIALIATPIVLNIITDTRESAKIRSAELYIDAVEQAIIREKMNNISFNPSSCTVTNGVVTCNSVPIQVDVDGTLPSEGTITINNGKTEYYDLKFDDKYVVYENGETTLQDQVIKLGRTYKLKDNTEVVVVATNSSVNSYEIEIVSVADTVVLKDGSEWYLIETNGDQVTLLSKYNYNTTTWEMDPNGDVHAISYEEVTDGEYDAFPNLLDQTIGQNIAPKIKSSLKVNSVVVDVPGYNINNLISVSGSPFWGFDAGTSSIINQDASGLAGVRAQLTIDKSYIKLIGVEENRISVNDEINVYTVASYNSEPELIKIDDFDDYSVYYASFSQGEYVAAYDMTNGNFLSNNKIGSSDSDIYATYAELADLLDIEGTDYECGEDPDGGPSSCRMSYTNSSGRTAYFYTELTGGNGDEYMYLDFIYLKIDK